jgi:integrase
MPLTEARVRSAKSLEKPYKMSDRAGLYCLVSPAGSKLWRLKFRFDGKEKLLSLGEYPRISIADARRRRDAALAQLDEGIDPSAEKQKRKRAIEGETSATFEAIAREWHANRLHEWTPKYGAQVLARLEADLFPAIGGKAIAKLEPREVLATLRTVEARGVLETTRRLKQYASAIFRYAIASGYCTHDPAAPLKGALKPPPRPVHHKALSRPDVGEFLVRLDAFEGALQTRIALQMALLTAVRTNELRAARWTEFEYLDDELKALWRIPADRMKMREGHLVPLSRQTLSALKTLRAATGRSPWLFPGAGREQVMSNNTMLFALYRMGYHNRTTTHGFRRLFSTEANENGFEPDWIERQLAHDERNRIRAAYNAAQYLPQRREMMQWWADQLDELKASAVATP